MNKKRGQAVLMIVFGLGAVGVLVAVAFAKLGPRSILRQQILSDSEKAYYASESGIEELMIRLRSHHNFGNEWDMSYELDDGSVFYATISGDINTRVATSTGRFADFTRRLEVKVASSSSKTSFLFAVQSGSGGFELEGNTEIRGLDGAAGNVYTNGDILGASLSSGNSGSKVLGDIWAVGKISGLNGDSSGGVYISGTAAANELLRCEVVGDVEAPAPPGGGCNYGGSYVVIEAPVVLPMEAIDIDFWKQQAVGSSTFVGDCVISSSGGPTDCSGAEKELGSVKIEGDLLVNSNTDFTLTGPVWVEGDLTIESNVNIDVAESLGSEGVVMVVDYPSDQFGKGKIEVASNVNFSQTSEGGPAMLVTTNNEDDCSAIPAVKAASNTESVVFSAPDGCVFFESNSLVRGVLAKKVHLSRNSVIEYDPRLATVILTTGLGGWEVTGFREITD